MRRRRGNLDAHTLTNAYLADILVFDPEMAVGAVLQGEDPDAGSPRLAATVKIEQGSARDSSTMRSRAGIRRPPEL